MDVIDAPLHWPLLLSYNIDIDISDSLLQVEQLQDSSAVAYVGTGKTPETLVALS